MLFIFNADNDTYLLLGCALLFMERFSARDAKLESRSPVNTLPAAVGWVAGTTVTLTTIKISRYTSVL
jgi:hypothetical protein